MLSGGNIDANAVQKALEPVIQASEARLRLDIVHGFHLVNQNIKSSVGALGTQLIEFLSGPTSTISFPNLPLYVHPKLLPTIAPFLLPGVSNPQWTCPQQALSVASVLHDEHVLSFMATALGKTLQVFAAPILKKEKLFIFILPLVSLTRNMEDRVSSLPYSVGRWTKDLDPFGIQLVIIPAHEAGTRAFADWLLLPYVQQRLDRIFIDEVHHLITDKNFRECFARLGDLTLAGAKYTLMSATCPPRDVPEILHILGITELSMVREIRSSTTRTNIQYTVEQCTNDNLYATVQSKFNSIVLQPDERGLIYASTLKDCDELSQLLSAPKYYAPIDPKEKDKIQEEWFSGVYKWLICTTAYGEGIDYSKVRWVFNVRPQGKTSEVQQGGRAGRDGELSYSHTIFTTFPAHFRGLGLTDDPHGKAGLYAGYQMDTCYRFSFRLYDKETYPCAAIPGAALCGFCLEQVYQYILILHLCC